MEAALSDARCATFGRLEEHGGEGRERGEGPGRQGKRQYRDWPSPLKAPVPSHRRRKKPVRLCESESEPENDGSSDQ